MAALAFLLLAAAATVLSPRPVEALLGRYNCGTGLVFVACVVGCWALGVVSDTRRVLGALLAGLALSSGVAVLQALVELPFDALDTSGRSVGLTGNAVHLGALAAAGTATCAWSRPAWTSLAGVAGFSAAVHLSGTRVALGSVLDSIVACGVRLRLRRAAVVAAAVMAGLAIGALAGAASSDRVSGATGRALGGDAAAGGTVTVRLHVWSAAADDVLERPLLGHGPGRLPSTASARHRDAALRWRREATRRQPGEPGPWLLLAATEASFGHRASAARAYHRALEADPWSLAAMLGLAETEDRSWRARAIAVWGDRARDAKQPGP